MTTIRSGFLLTPIGMTLNDLECPIHLSDVRMLWLSELTMRDCLNGQRQKYGQ